MSVTLPQPFITFRITRDHTLREVDGMPEKDLLAIPEGRNDNVLWNLGHLLCSLSRLTYVFSGHPLPIPEDYLSQFGKGTNARQWTETPNCAEVLTAFRAMPGRIESDFEAGHFTTYKPIELVKGYPIASVEEAVAFHCFHEGLHLGRIMTLKELLGYGGDV